LIQEAIQIVGEFNPALLFVMDPEFDEAVGRVEESGGTAADIRDCIEGVVAREKRRAPNARTPFSTLYYLARPLRETAALLKHPEGVPASSARFNNRGLLATVDDEAANRAYDEEQIAAAAAARAAGAARLAAQEARA
jgi:hypothetical protein